MWRIRVFLLKNTYIDNKMASLDYGEGGIIMGLRSRRWIVRCLELVVLFCLILPSLRGVNLASDDTADSKDKRLHYIVRHWHADGTHTDDEGYLKEGDSTKVVYVKPKSGETFTGFATAAGHDAVKREWNEKDPANSILRISYEKDIHLAKVHAFYKNTNLEEGATDLRAKETKEKADGTKVYNTSKEGLHTDKTAKALKGDGRDFELSLESWFVGNNQSDVGMVLDASGSMAFTSNDLEPIKMSRKQIEEYGTMKYIAQDKVNDILNPFYTDNSKLAYSGYSYFVYDPSDGTKEFVPIGYWNGVAKTIWPETGELPTKNLQGYYSFNSKADLWNEAEILTKSRDKDSVTQDKDKEVMVSYIPAGGKDGKVSINNNKPQCSEKGTGFNDKNSALDLAKSYREKSKSAARLDLHPKKGEFTISFAVRGSSTKPVIWIGDADQTQTQAWYAVYADSKAGKIKVSGGTGVTTAGNDIDNNAGGVTSISASFDSAKDWAVCTCSFIQGSDNKAEVAVYVNNKKIKTGSLPDIFATGNMKQPYILLGGSAWAHDYGGKNWETDQEASFLVDELYFYDRALSDNEVKLLYHEMPAIISTVTPSAATIPSDQDKTMARMQFADSTGDGEGWYLVSSDSAWDDITNKELLTSKRYNGIPAKEVIFNQIHEVPRGARDPSKGDTDTYIYTGNEDFSGNPGDSAAIEKNAGWNGSMIFYIDNEGYLRCFFNTGKAQDRGTETDGRLNINNIAKDKNHSYCSYVYKKDDRMRIKTEALQRALGSFVTRLSEMSPKSRVSAVRFSTDKILDPSTLILQNWTSNTMDSTGMLGLRRGDERNILSFDESDGMKLYNYALTGGTVTKTGLKAYLELLDDTLDRKEEADKTLIIFTDGKDTTDREGAEKLASELKQKGYRIYCVMLQSAGNPMKDSYDFLENMASGEEFVFSAEDVDSLTEVFTKGILDRIINNLPGYTVQDYIDPRFDLVDAGGNVIHLKAGGTITAAGKTKKLNRQTGHQISITKTGTGDAAGTVGEKALLFYDEQRDMYYLQWKEQTIPGCSTGAARLNVWKTRIHVRAKEDFIGGNAVISNGNADGMNMIYHPDSENPSSGENDTQCERDKETGEILHYPSKGFPRTTVNVALLKLKLEDVRRKIYMGQTIVPGDALSVLGSKVKEPVYYEYLERYMNWLSLQKNGKPQDLMERLKGGNQVRIPYYYLPDAKGSNQAGKVQPGDQIGWLAYKWTQCDKNGVPRQKGTYTSFVTKDTDSRYYQLAVSYQPMSEKERAKETGRIISDQNYASPKAAAGAAQKTEVRGLGTHRTDIVRGELVVEARVRLADLNYLIAKNAGKWNREESFSVTRFYEGKEEEFKIKISFSYTTEKLKGMKADKDGYISVFSEPTRALPIGRYVVKAENKKTFPFTGIKARRVVNGNGHFSKSYTKAKKEGKYAAPSSRGEKNTSVSFYLGVPMERDASGVDLDAQLGHAVITYGDITASTRLGDKLPTGRTDAGKGPGTGDEARPVHVLILMLSSMGVIVAIFRNRVRN